MFVLIFIFKIPFKTHRKNKLYVMDRKYEWTEDTKSKTNDITIICHLATCDCIVCCIVGLSEKVKNGEGAMNTMVVRW